jgi:hypothetical protein
MKVSVETITPSLAKKWLEKNASHQRFLKSKTVSKYADQMLKGKWNDETGDPIQFDIEGNLVNGQHRLNAVAISNTTHKWIVVKDLPVESFAFMDIGMKRTGGDILHIEGAKQALQLAGIIRKYLLLKTGYFGRQGGEYNRIITNETVLAEFRKRKKWWNQVNDNATEWYHEFNKFLTPSDVGGFYAFFNDKNSDKVTDFFIKLCTGINLDLSDPIRHLRKILMKSKDDKIIAKTKAALIIKTWNFFIEKKTIDRLTFNSEREEYPKAIAS